ncbi:PEP-utilizing enzyme [Achromobacter xylosoxidans]
MAGGAPSVTAAQSYALMDLAALARDDAAALAWLRAPDRRGSDWRDALPPDSPFRRAFADFLERYGHRAVYETYLRHPRWREAPDYLLDSVLNLIGADLAALRAPGGRRACGLADAERGAAALEAAAGAVADRRRAVGLPPARGRAQRAGRLRRRRQALRAGAGRTLRRPRRPGRARRCVPPERRGIAGPGRRRAAGGGGGPARRVAQDTAATMGGRGRPGRGGGKRRRRAGRPLRAARRGCRNRSRRRQLARHAGGGWPCARPRIRGPRSGAGLAMPAGAVLVAPSTDPAWTPLFLRASALVMEAGGYLSHGAIVAREFGIPALASVPGILDAVADGDLLDVDAGAGRVSRVAATAKRDLA